MLRNMNVAQLIKCEFKRANVEVGQGTAPDQKGAPSRRLE
jgi:hypothetical protein